MSYCSDKYVIVEKKQLDDLVGAYNAAAEEAAYSAARFVRIVKCASCGTFHPDKYICPECGADPEDVGSEVPDLNIRILPVYEDNKRQ